jgi:antitoxin (DNA-binding transcriptional repressor) of toxin-antitoxin stability system
MPTLSLAEVEQRYDEIVECVIQGEEFIVTRDGQAHFRMVPLGPDASQLGPADAVAGAPKGATARQVTTGEPEEP